MAPSVLVVDDEPDIRSTLAWYLAASLPGATVLQAVDAQEALKIARHHTVDVVLTDYLMPGMDGLSLVQALHRLRPETKGVLLTAYPDPEVAQRAVEILGADAVLAKPADPWRITAAVARRLGGSFVQTLHDAQDPASGHHPAWTDPSSAPVPA